MHGNFSLLSEVLARPMTASHMRMLGSCPQSSYRQLCTSPKAKASQRLAIIVSGRPRTMLQLDVVSAYADLMELARQKQWQLHVFAHLDYARPDHYRDGHQYHGPTASVGDVRSALQDRWRVPHSHQCEGEQPAGANSTECGRPDTCWPGVPSNSAPSPLRGHEKGIHVLTRSQFLKVASGFEMMRRAEEQSGEMFDVVLRLRPDLCIRGALATIGVVLGHVGRCSPLVVTWHDAIAFVPRWAADSFGGLWRSPSCPGATPSSDSAFLFNQSSLWPIGGVANVGGRLEKLGVGGLELIDFLCPRPAHGYPRRVHDTPPCRDRLAMRRPHELAVEGMVDGGRQYRKVPLHGHCAFFS